jgi:hypothetical protein
MKIRPTLPVECRIFKAASAPAFSGAAGSSEHLPQRRPPSIAADLRCAARRRAAPDDRQAVRPLVRVIAPSAAGAPSEQR